MTWDTPIPGIRLRALQSRDVRAPNLSELFFPPSGLNGSINNDFVNAVAPGTGNNQNVRQLNEGNSLLKNERSQTTEMGVVWQPDFIPGFQASVDYYRIGVKGPIIALGLQQVEDLCFAGFTTFCSQDAINTSNGVNQSAANPAGGTGITAVASRCSTSAASSPTALTWNRYQFDLRRSGQLHLAFVDQPHQQVHRGLGHSGHTAQCGNRGLLGRRRQQHPVQCQLQR